ncbi:MAG: DISARM system phospholipase D-like protein DrmC [Bryobacterales bacterium]|nr:DISARM system phospholipase D-like protein DrmC [Bryobacterales bacterium]MDE0296598.1 DISARM system phospholipase D-like protein DrmC [Bryobacterales bacterium]MDE0432920.1 DISARM system phospholipase D-like protein DrmC [Bryobacterales bacterium]
MREFHALSELERDDLIRLAELLEAGLLKPPLGPLTLRNQVAVSQVEPITRWFEDLSRYELTSEQMALVLRAFTAGSSTGSKAAASVEIVVSGPDATLMARNTSVVIRQMFEKARQRVLAVGFAIHQGKSVFQALARRLDGQGLLDVILCIDVRRQRDDSSIDSHVVRRFAENFIDKEWPGTRLPRVYYDPRSLAPAAQAYSAMHAKCVVIDGLEALVTSANFTEAAQERNIELGLLVDSSGIAHRIEEHFMSLIRNGYLERLPLT